MRTFGITYDTGFSSRGSTTREPYDPAVVRREMGIIRTELHCDAVRITGSDPDRLETAARYAADAGLAVWYSPFTNGLSKNELCDVLTDCAVRAEQLRRAGAEVVLLTGSEISLFTDGFLPGRTLEERTAVLTDPQRVRAALPRLHADINTVLGEVTAAVRARFGGPVGYASLPFEGVDWTPFDIVATDAYYPDPRTVDQFDEGLRALTRHGKPAAITEFGCTTYRGAAKDAGRGDAVIAWDDAARPARFTSTVIRDEQQQADYLLTVLATLERSGIEAAFVNTFARYDLPHSIHDERDFDKASYGIVKVFDDGRTGTAYPGLPWEPKAAFHALARYGHDRATTPR